MEGHCLSETEPYFRVVTYCSLPRNDDTDDDDDDDDDGDDVDDDNDDVEQCMIYL